MSKRKNKKNYFKRMFSIFTALILCMTTSVYAAEAEYNALDGTSPDKPENYSEFSYYEGYNTGGGYDMVKFYVVDELEKYAHSLYLPNYDTYNESLTYLISFSFGTKFSYTYGKGIVSDKITLTDLVDEGHIELYDLFSNVEGPFVSFDESGTFPSVQTAFIPYESSSPYRFLLDSSKFVSCDWTSTSISDVVVFDTNNLTTAPRLYSNSVTFNRANKNLRVYDVDYICLWNGDMLGNFKRGSLTASDIESFTSNEALDTIDYVQEPYLAQCMFVSLLSDGSVEQCSDEQLARLGVYRADRFDYDSDTDSCIPKNNLSVKYDLPVPSGVEVQVDKSTGAYEVLWDNSTVLTTYPNSSLNLIMLYSGTIRKYVSGTVNSGDKTFIGSLLGASTAFSYVDSPTNVKIINRVLTLNDGVSFVSNANINNALRTYYDIDDTYYMVAEPSEVHFLLRNFYYEQSSNIYHFSNWVDVKIVVTYNNGDMDYETTIREISSSATSDDILQSLNGGNTGTNADVGNADNVTGGDGDITYDGTTSHVTVSGAVDNSNLLSFVSNGFGILGDNGALAIFGDIYTFMPSSIWTVVGCFVSAALVIALFKLIF